jgi:hypothetical protein
MVLAFVARSPFASALLLAFQPANDGIRYFSLKSSEPDHGLAWFVLNAFFLVAVALGVTLLVGIAFGGFRLWLLNRFPNNRFNGAPDEPFSLSFPREDLAKPEPEEKLGTGTNF